MTKIQPDPIEKKLQLTRERSVANSRWEFRFKGFGERAIFPILLQPQVGRPKLIGTGFFVLPNGFFCTARHVFEGNDIKDDDEVDLILDLEGELVQTPVKRLFRHENLDLAFGMAETGHEVPVVSIMNLDPEVTDNGAEPLGASVFSHTLVSEFDPVDKDIVVVSRRWHWELGYLEEIHENGCRHVRGRCYSTSIFAEGRSSGAPVFNSNGFAIGVINTGLAPADVCPISTVTNLWQVMQLPVDGVSLWEQHKPFAKIPSVRVTRKQS